MSVIKDTNPKDAVGVAKAPSSTLSAAVKAEVGLAMMEGALKYGRHNYRVAGVRASVYYDAANRHLDAWWEGQDLDPDSELSHITKAIAGLFVLRDAMIQDMLMDDRPPPSPEGWLDELNAKAKALLRQYPEDERVAAYVAADTLELNDEGRPMGIHESAASQLRAKIAYRKEVLTDFPLTPNEKVSLGVIDNGSPNGGTVDLPPRLDARTNEWTTGYHINQYGDITEWPGDRVEEFVAHHIKWEAETDHGLDTLRGINFSVNGVDLTTPNGLDVVQLEALLFHAGMDAGYRYRVMTRMRKTESYVPVAGTSFKVYEGQMFKLSKVDVPENTTIIVNDIDHEWPLGPITMGELMILASLTDSPSGIFTVTHYDPETREENDYTGDLGLKWAVTPSATFKLRVRLEDFDRNDDPVSMIPESPIEIVEADRPE